MPPRKSNVSAISTTNEDGGTPTKEPRDGVNIEVKPRPLLPRPAQLPSPMAPPPTPLLPPYPLSLTYTLETPFLVPPELAFNVFPTTGLSTHSPIRFLALEERAWGQHAATAAAASTLPIHAYNPAPLAGQVPPQGPLLLPVSTAVTDASSPPQDLSLPKTMVQRLAKGVLPPNTQIPKDALLAMQKGATVFVNYLAQAANATAQTNNRRTIPPNAIFDALQELEFEAFEQRVQAELTKFNETQTGKRNEYRRKLKEESRAKQEGGDGAANGTKGEGESEGDGEGGRSAKRARMGEEGQEEDVGGVEVNGHGANGREDRRHGDGDGDGDGDGEQDEVIDIDDREEEENENENENEGEENAEEDEEEDDEDEYPDEGRRLSSLEPDTYTDAEARHRVGSEDEAMSDEGSD